MKDTFLILASLLLASLKVSEKDHTHWTYEPGVAMKITQQMLDEAKVRVLTKRVLKAITKEGARIMQLRTSDGDFSAKVFIDASYEGDLMAAASVSWTIGREGRKEFGKSFAGKQYPKPLIPISGRDDAGELLPLITTEDAGPEDAGDKNVMVYSFRLCLTKDPANRVPIPAPAHYDPARFEVIRRHFSQGKATAMWDLYPLPNEKFDANNGIWKQFSLGLVGACNGWSEADEAGRAKIWEAHKQYTLELYHFFCSDPSVPKALRKQHAELGLCRDEFASYGHWSPQLYVREGRRMKGSYVVSQKDIIVEPTWMILGQSAGVAAALAAKQNVTVQKLPYPTLRGRLLAQNQVLDISVLAEPSPDQLKQK